MAGLNLILVRRDLEMDSGIQVKFKIEMIDLLANFTRKRIIQQILILLLVALILELFMMKQMIIGKPSLKLFT